MKKTILISAILWLGIMMTQAQNRVRTLDELKQFPAYEEVVDYVFDHHKIPMAQLVRIDRTPMGWTLRILDATDFTSTAFKSPVWAFESGQWMDIPLEKDSTVKQNLKQNFYRSNPVKWYLIYPFYGYADWDLDNIDFLRNIDALSDTALYALGRSYGNLATRQIRPQFGFGSIQARDFGYEQIPNQIADSLVLLFRNSIEQYTLLRDRSPDFQTIVGDINTKMSNEWISAYHTLLSVKETERANQFKKADLFDPIVLEVAENYLKSCPENAILFTHGDNDTYPLWYLQSGGYRNDVQVINVSLLNTEWYFEMIQKETSDKKQPELFNFKTEDFANDRLAFAYVISGEDTVFDLSGIVEYLSNKENDIEFGNSSYPAIPTNKMMFEIADFDRSFFHLDSEDAVFPVLEWEIRNRYLTRSGLLTLDLISKNISVRPICFAVTNASATYQGLDNYLRLEGMTYRLVPMSKKDTRNTGWVGIEQCEKTLLNDFSFKSFRKKTTNEDFAGRMVLNYRINMYRLAESFIDANETVKAKKTMKVVSKSFPQKKYPLKHAGLSSAEVYYRLGEIKKANRQLLFAAGSLNIEKPYDQNIMKYMIQISENNNQTEVAEKLKEYLLTK